MPNKQVSQYIECFKKADEDELSIKIIHRDLEYLNRYYIETRYPWDYPIFTATECREAYEFALQVKKFVLERTQQ